MSEKFLIKAEGGPVPGVRVADSADPRYGNWSWPLPDTLPYNETGHYVKVSESDLPEGHEGVLRGAIYQWEPSE